MRNPKPEPQSRLSIAGAIAPLAPDLATIIASVMTALAERIRKLDAAPNIENLGDARRSVSQLHQAIHAPENFKLAASL